MFIEKHRCTEEIDKCLFCGSLGALLYVHIPDYKLNTVGEWNFLRCPMCGLIWITPRPIQEELSKYYKGYYTQKPVIKKTRRMWLVPVLKIIKRGVIATSFGYLDYSNKKERMIGHLLSWFSPLRDQVGADLMWLEYKPAGKLLDVGCGNGLFLDRMKELGWDVFGIEPDPLAAQKAMIKLGSNVFCGDLDENKFPKDYFDAITAQHVIEHVADPNSFIKRCYNILKPGGKLVIMTPNANSLGHKTFSASWRGLDTPRHIYIFTQESLRICIQRLGFAVATIRTISSLLTYAIWVGSKMNGQDKMQSFKTNKPKLRIAKFEAAVYMAIEVAFNMLRPIGEEILLVIGKKE